jgi:hypothetical protein
MGEKLKFYLLKSILLGMRGENFIYGGGNSEDRNNFEQKVRPLCSKDGHVFIGSGPPNVAEIWITCGMGPTLAFLGNDFPDEEKGGRIVELIRKYSKGTIIVSYCKEEVKWGDHHLSPDASGEEIARFLLDLRH